MAAQYIFQMQGLTKAYPGGKKVFENIWLSFYPDAKIGVVGVNGSGKSTLLKILSGLDTEFSGEARWITNGPGPGMANRIVPPSWEALKRPFTDWNNLSDHALELALVSRKADE